MFSRTPAHIAFLAATTLAVTQTIADPPSVIRAGMIGLDTSHVVAFTKVFNDPNATGDLADVKIASAWPGGNPAFPLSRNRVKGFTKQVRNMGVEIVDSIDTLLTKVDVILLTSVDGTQHLQQAEIVFKAGKPTFIDKPLAASLADALAIYQLGKQYNVPWFSSSSLRFSPGFLSMRDNKEIGNIIGCDAYSQSRAAPGHPDLFWYGVHGVEILYTIMGTGCTSVTRVQTEFSEQVTGQWSDGRIGTYRGIREHTHKTRFGATVFTTKQIAQAGPYVGYNPLAQAIATFCKTKTPPVAPEETLEMFAFMAAAEESKYRAGTPVTLEQVMNKAKAELAARK